MHHSTVLKVLSDDSDQPLAEWHAFVTMSNWKEINGFSVVIGNF